MTTDHGSSTSSLRPGQRLLLAALLIALVAGPAAYDAFRPPYWAYPDPDLIFAYSGLVMAEWLPQEYFDHTGYFFLLVLGGWYQLLHTAGLLGAHTISTLPPLQDRAAFDAAWTGIIQAGRALMVLTAIGYVLIFAGLVGRWQKDWRLGLLAGVLIAGAAGVASQAYHLRSELISSLLVVATIFMALLAPRQRSIGRQLVLMTIAGLCAVLAVATKVFAFVPLLVVPLLVLVLMDPKPETSRPEQSPLSARMLAIVLIVGTLTILPAAAMVAHALSQSGNTFFRYAPLAFGLFGLYQAGFALLVLGAIAIYARIRKVPLGTAFAATVALGIGVALGVLALGIKYDPRNVTALLYPVEHLFEFSRWSNPDLIKEANVVSENLLGKFVAGISAVLKLRVFPTRTPTNMVMLEWLILIGMVLGRRDSDRRWIWQAALLVLVAWGIQFLFELRRPILWYFSYSDPFTVMAAIVVAARWRDVLFSRRSRAVTAAAALLFVVHGHGQIRGFTKFKYDLRMTCDWHDAYLRRLEKFPECGG